MDRTRTEQIKIWATPEEKALIRKKMEIFGTSNMGAYIRKMAIDGYVVKLEIPEMQEMVRLLGISSNNLNQMAKKLHATGHVYAADIDDLRTRLDEIYECAGTIIGQLANIK